jgi:hypothetical protein
MMIGTKAVEQDSRPGFPGQHILDMSGRKVEVGSHKAGQTIEVETGKVEMNFMLLLSNFLISILVSAFRTLASIPLGNEPIQRFGWIFFHNPPRDRAHKAARFRAVKRNSRSDAALLTNFNQRHFFKA